jgi:hypothetical protein
VAIGPNDLYARLTSSANFERFLKARVEGYGIGLGAGSLDKAVVPAYAGTVALAYARALPPGQTPAPTSAGSGP